MSEQATPMPTPMMLGAPPSISLQALPGYGVAPLTVAFLVNESDPDQAEFVRYEWNFGDGHVSTLPPLMVYETYINPGSYTVRLTAVTADGRSASALAGVVVAPPSPQ